MKTHKNQDCEDSSSRQNQKVNYFVTEQTNVLGAQNMTSAEINIITYNILSSELATEAYFPSTNPIHLQSYHRLNMILMFLNKYIGNNYIICLQEVSTEWSETIGSHVNKFGYEYHYVPYDERLGVIIAYPAINEENINYSLMGMGEYRVGDIIRQNMLSFTSDKEILDAMDSKQKLLIIKLFDSRTKKILNIATYHMPCKFTKQTFMETHIMFCMKQINEFVMEEPVIFTGDFNSKFGENNYNLLTRCIPSTLNSQQITYLYPTVLRPFNDSLSFNLNRDFTCYNQINKETFIIDYIFYRNITLNRSEVVKTSLFSDDKSTNQTNPTLLPIPSEYFPSDHLPIIGTFTL